MLCLTDACAFNKFIVYKKKLCDQIIGLSADLIYNLKVQIDKQKENVWKIPENLHEKLEIIAEFDQFLVNFVTKNGAT